MYKCIGDRCRFYEEARFSGSFAITRTCYFNKEKAQRIVAGFSCPKEELRHYQQEQARKHSEKEMQDSFFYKHDDTVHFNK